MVQTVSTVGFNIGTAWCVLQMDAGDDICIVKPQEIWLSFTQIKMSNFGEVAFSGFSKFFSSREA